MEKLSKNLLKKLKLPKVNKKRDVMSCVLCMVLVVLASQSRVFDFLIDNNLGRIGLLALVLTICCTSKIFGVASILFLVLAFAVHNNSQEGMCGGKKKEGFGAMSKEDRLSQERDLQKGQQPYNETVKKSGSCGAKPHDNLESEFGSTI